MTETQKRFVKLEKQRKTILEEFDTALQEVAAEVGVDGYFQDEDGVVYKVTCPTGRWVKFDTVSYVRTRRDDEKQGTLSQKEATEAGFKV